MNSRMSTFTFLVTEEPVTIIDSVSIGPHAITIVKASDVDSRSEWTIEYLKSLELPGVLPDPERFAGVVEPSLSRDIPYFVFDLVPMEKSGEEIRPVG